MTTFAPLDTYNVSRRYTPDSPVILWLNQIKEEFCSDTPVVGVFNIVEAFLLVDRYNYCKAVGLSLIIDDTEDAASREECVRKRLTSCAMRFTSYRTIFGQRIFTIDSVEFFRGMLKSMYLFRHISNFDDASLISAMVAEGVINKKDEL